MKVNLVDSIKLLEQKINRLENEKKQEMQKIEEKYQKLIEKYRIVLETLKELNEVCINCGGAGTEKYIDASGNWDYRICPVCHGTGLKTEQKQEGEP